jgi:hypothetical protein
MTNDIRIEGNRKFCYRADGKTLYSIVEVYIGIGPTATFYTLWEQVIFCGGQDRGGLPARYLQNLAQDKDEALAKARELTGIDLSNDVFDVDTHGSKIERHARRAMKFHFGAYLGCNIDEVYNGECDRQDRLSKNGLPLVGRKYVQSMARWSWSPSDVAFVNNIAYATARYGETAAEEGYWQLSSQFVRDHDRAAKDAARADFPITNKRVTVTGQILSTKVVENGFGTCIKMLVETDEGWKCWGTVPSSLSDNAIGRGTRIQFDAKLERSRDDRSFGFFSRPTKAVILKQALVA